MQFVFRLDRLVGPVILSVDVYYVGIVVWKDFQGFGRSCTVNISKSLEFCLSGILLWGLNASCQWLYEQVWELFRVVAMLILGL